MTATPKGRLWKKGRGKLGALDPLLGAWEAEAASPVGPTRCVRTFAKALNGSYVVLDALWEFSGKQYQEHAVHGVHAEAVGFEARMPAGLARMVYWPAEDGGAHWAVESRTKKGWNRFAEHHYRAR